MPVLPHENIFRPPPEPNDEPPRDTLPDPDDARRGDSLPADALADPDDARRGDSLPALPDPDDARRGDSLPADALRGDPDDALFEGLHVSASSQAQTLQQVGDVLDAILGARYFFSVFGSRRVGVAAQDVSDLVGY